MKPTILITGCGYKPVSHTYIYKTKPTHDSIVIDGKEQKMNIGTACAFYFAKKGIPVILVSKSEEKLKNIREGLLKLQCRAELVSYIPADLMTDRGITSLVKKLPKNMTFYWIQSVGIGAGTYKVPHDNIYLPFEKITPEIMKAELEVTISTHRTLLKLIPTLRRQIYKGQKAKIAIVTSMSGERGYHFGGTHVAAKHALVGYIKGVERELEDEGIQIFDIRPGAIDTGMYDNPYTRKVVEKISRKSRLWGGRKPTFARPTDVAKSVYLAFFTKHPKKVYKILAPHQK